MHFFHIRKKNREEIERIKESKTQPSEVCYHQKANAAASTASPIDALLPVVVAIPISIQRPSRSYRKDLLKEA